ncbi:MAG: M23 family metallopeptidase [Patescibacteria group bacterium]|nr:M23 family metallopeptidase [Patescibacteria group bacterium]
MNEANTDIKNIVTAHAITWTQEFIPPLTNITITNPYGYGVSTGAYVIPHKGTDFKAAVGTKLVAMNSGVVKISKNYPFSYGNMVVIDHGLGIETLYLHLSRMDVKVGDAVARGQTIGLSGDTGYVSGPHLHLSIKVGGISIDPMQFLKLFNP